MLHAKFGMSSGRTLAAAPTALVALVVLAGAAGDARAHQSSFTYGSLDIEPDAGRVVYRIKLKSTDLYEGLGLDRDRDATDSEIETGAAALYDYVGARVELGLDGCDERREPLAIEGGRDRYAVLTFAYRCRSPIDRIALDYDLFFDLDPRHIGLLLVEGDTVQLTQPDHRSFAWERGAAIEGGIGFVRSGVDHILFGLDHILFVFALLLMAVIARNEQGGWKLRPIGEAAAYAGAIVTSFTIAHSLTLIAAALGWIDLSSRVVESAIAASIIYVAIENAVRPDPPRRYLVTFAFGLIHGLGFAAMLRPLLPPEGVVGPLLLFNVGVELGQLGIVLVAMPLLYGLARVLGAGRYRRVALPAGAAVLGTIGTIWLIERALDVEILGL